MDISTSAYSNARANSLFAKLDTDSSGGISEEEFTTGRPDDVTEEQAANLFDQLDSSSSGVLSTTDIEGMGQDAPQKFSEETALSLIEQQEADSSEDTTSSFLTAMDTDGDGTITEEEFISARPDDVTEEMAQNLWNQMDTENAGELSTEEIEVAMTSSRAGGPPPPSSSEEDDEDDLTSIVSSMDTNGDGIVSEEEFLAARPDDVTEEMAQNLWDQMDTENAGELSTDEIEVAMASAGPGGAPPPPSSSEEDDEDDLTSIVSSMDTNGDGIVSQDEFLAARPDDVTEEMAQNLWNQMDTENAGELSTDEIEVAMATSRPDGPPPSVEASDTSTEEDTLQSIIDQLTASAETTETEETSSISAEFRQALSSYGETLNFAQQDQNLSSLLATA